jgi:hypothetical protein
MAMRSMRVVIVGVAVIVLAKAMISSKEVRFDLDGTSRPVKYALLRPHAALLASDPLHNGKIESG